MSTLPKKFDKYFWEFDVKELDTQIHQKFIIERILDKGNFSSISWLSKLYGLESIEEVISSSKNLSRKTVNFWSIILQNNE